MYLGRDSKKNFCWYYVGNESVLMENNINRYLSNCERAKNNKKCKRLAYALNDPNAYISSEVANLIRVGWKANLSGLDLG